MIFQYSFFPLLGPFAEMAVVPAIEESLGLTAAENYALGELDDHFKQATSVPISASENDIFTVQYMHRLAKRSKW